MNDVSICQIDEFTNGVMHGTLENVTYEVYNSYGDQVSAKGGYVIVDGGFKDSIFFMDPDKFRMTRENVLWSEWVESVRKDVECTFGAIKSRFRFFRNAVSYGDPEIIDAAFKTACALHNMILDFDGKASVAERDSRIPWATQVCHPHQYRSDQGHTCHKKCPDNCQWLVSS
jgi:hypothetical protein